MITLLAFGMPAAPEWIFIGILALVLFGPKRIPEIARGLGKALGELQRAKEDFHREISGVPPLPKIESPQGQVSQSGGAVTAPHSSGENGSVVAGERDSSEKKESV
jgi:sec-independent protein translocase protein TatA